MVERYGKQQGDYDDDEPMQKKPALNQFIPYLAVIAISIIGSIMYANTLVKDVVHTGDIDTLVAGVKEVQTRVEGAVNGIPNTVTTQVNNALSSMSNQINNIQTSVNDVKSEVVGYRGSIESTNDRIDTANSGISSLNTKVNSLTSKDSEVVSQITALQTEIATLKTRVSELEAPTSSSSSSSGGGSVIPNFTIDTRVTEEGTLRTSDNATISELKLTLTNSNTRDIEDIVLYVTVWFDDGGTGSKSILSTSYGSWSIRREYTDELQLKARINRISDSESKRIYISLISYANYKELGRATYLDVNSDSVEVIDWNYGN